MDHYKIVSIDGRTFVFSIGASDEIKIGISESTDLGSLIGFCKRYRNDKLGVSLKYN